MLVANMECLMKVGDKFSIVLHASYSIYEILTYIKCCPEHSATK